MIFYLSSDTKVRGDFTVQWRDYLFAPCHNVNWWSQNVLGKKRDSVKCARKTKFGHLVWNYINLSLFSFFSSFTFFTLICWVSLQCKLNVSQSDNVLRVGCQVYLQLRCISQYSGWYCRVYQLLIWCAPFRLDAVKPEAISVSLLH